MAHASSSTSSNATTVSRLQNELRCSKEELVKVSDQIKNLSSRKKELEKNICDIKSELNLLNEGDSSVSQFDRDDFSWSSQVMSTLKSVFKIQSFRSHQKAAINATMNGVDLILVMPTGGGKSLCFQLPAVLSSGVTLVVSPLISLMQDQLEGLEALGIECSVFNAQTDKDETKKIFQAMIDPKSNMKMLYVTPEKLAKSKRLMSQLEKMYKLGKFSRLVIDEVHCCSQWGHDFRPDYKFLGIFKKQYPKTPIIGLTATATANVLIDIQKMLNIEGCIVLRDSFYRPNLRYSVVDSTKTEKIEDIAELIKSKFSGQTGIIYGLTVKDVEEVATKLREQHKISAGAYHAQLEPDARLKVQQDWNKNKLQVIVGTVAFGMGINKLSVRFVIHYSMSKSIENYYQETGRAGRDGEDAECILFYGFQDSFRASSLMFTEKNGTKNVYNMLRYTLDQVGCRKKFIAIHFGDSCGIIENGCGKCDNCEAKMDEFGRSRIEVEVNATRILLDLIKLIENASKLDERMTALKLIDSLFNKGSSKLRLGSVKVPKYSREICEKLIGHLLVDSYLNEEFHFTPYTTISYLIPGPNSYHVTEDEDLTYTFYSTNFSSAPNKNKSEASNSSKYSKSSPTVTQKKPTTNRNKRTLAYSDDDSESEEDFQPFAKAKKSKAKENGAKANNTSSKDEKNGIITLD